MTETEEMVGGSFRDPSGVVFRREGAVYRRINPVYREHYEHLVSSGLYKVLVERQLLVAHQEACIAGDMTRGAYKTLRPELAPFISYPYEWCFGQLRDAALAALAIQGIALRHGMILKDASAYNMQFIGGKPRLIDTLSFEIYREGEPWIAYRQFCQHFLAPLLLMAYRDPSLIRLLALHLDGIPLPLASQLLPLAARWRPSVFSHIQLHARTQQRFSRRQQVRVQRRSISRLGMQGLVANLTSLVSSLRPHGNPSHWSGYYGDNSYTGPAFGHKQRAVSRFLAGLRPAMVWDLGANTGVFSLIAAAQGALTVAFDADHAAVDAHYRECVSQGQNRVLPLVVDLTNPSAAIGWNHQERDSLASRGPCDTALALALVHHLAISNNVPLDQIAAWLRRLCRSLIIEFVPKNDPQCQRLLASRRDIFPNYHREGFEQAFSRHFRVEEKAGLPDSSRVIYRMR
jgi:hypothetical protein